MVPGRAPRAARARRHAGAAQRRAPDARRADGARGLVQPGSVSDAGRVHLAESDLPADRTRTLLRDALLSAQHRLSRTEGRVGRGTHAPRLPARRRADGDIVPASGASRGISDRPIATRRRTGRLPRREQKSRLTQTFPAWRSVFLQVRAGARFADRQRMGTSARLWARSLATITLPGSETRGFS